MNSPVNAPPTGNGVDGTLFRKSVSLFATGIVVLTCEDNDGNVHGMTVNSFTSVNLDPPTVLVSLKPGKAHRLISRNGRYGALHPERGPAQFFRAFQRPSAGSPAAGFPGA